MNRIYLLASGDLRESANRVCWPAQEAMEKALTGAMAKLGAEIVRAHHYDPERGHGFLSSQRMGLDTFRDLPPDAPVVVAQSVWQYSHHVLPGLITHKGPILTVANWSGHVAGPGRHAQPERLAHQGRRQVLDALERGLYRCAFPGWTARWLSDWKVDHLIDHIQSDFVVPEKTRATARRLAAELRQPRRSWACSTKAAWACSTPSSPTTC